MGFVEPLMLAGVAAASVPVLVHLLGRRRAPRRRFSALSFVLRHDRRLARGLRLKQWLLLALRVLLVAAMAVMMAKPVSERESTLPALGGGPQSAVVIVDDTLSMSWRAEGERLFDRARRRALELLRLLGPQAEIAVLSLSHPDGPLPRLSRDHRAVRAAIGDLRATARHAPFAAALAHARGLLAAASTPQRRVFLISDFAAHNGAIGGAPAATEPAIHPIDVAEGSVPENRAVVALSAAPSSAPGRHATRVSARVCNFAAQRAEVLVELLVDGERAARGHVTLAPWACGAKHFNHNFTRGGAHETVVALEPDALPEDDRRYLRVDLQRGIRVLLVNGDPSPIRHRDELYYVDTALTSGAREQVVTSVVTADELGRVRFDANDVVLLCNVRELPLGRVPDLVTFVDRGGGLLISVGDQVREDAFNQSLGKLLPQELRGPGSGTARGADGAVLRIGRADPQHPVIAAIGGAGEGYGLRSARFARVFRLWPTSAAAGRRVVLSFDDGSPALVEARRGAGRVLLFASTLDRDWNDLPIRPGFVPLVQQSVRYLARALQPMAGASVAAGAKRLIRVPSWAERVRLIGPGGEERVWSGDALSGRRAVEIVADQPGFYTVSAVTGEGAVRALARESFVVNTEPREADLRRQRAAQPRGTTTARARQRVELWHGIGVLLLALLLGEALLTRRG